jgi:hypothetical protein
MLLREFLNRTGEGKACVVGWGRGMGHKGHMFLASSVITQAKQEGADPYFVVSRTVGKDDPITPEEKLAIYQKVFPKHGHIFHTATEEMPDLTRVLQKLNEHGYTKCTVVVGADQVKALGYVKNYNGKPDKAGNIPFNFADGLSVISRQETNDPSREEEGPRATPMRAVLKDPNVSDEEKFQTWRDAMSPELSDEEVRELMVKAMNRMNDPSFGKKVKAESVFKESVKYANKVIREMRAKEFARQQLAELSVKPSQPVHRGLDQHGQGVYLARDVGGYDRVYHMNRLWMAMACADGKSANATNSPASGWSEKYNTIHPFSDADDLKIQSALKTVPSDHGHISKDHKSREHNDTNIVSPVAKPKKNKYGI